MEGRFSGLCYGYRGYRILDGDAQPVKAAAQFLYKGYEVSFSTVLDPYPTEVCVFEPDDKFSVTLHSCHTVQEALAWCDSNPKPE